MTRKFQCTDLNMLIQNNCLGLLQHYFPNGILLNGKEFAVGSINGEKGISLRFNIQKGVGSDFGTGETFSSIIQLVASARGISFKEANKEIATLIGNDSIQQKTFRRYIANPKPRKTFDKLPIKIPAPENSPEIARRKPDHVYKYRNTVGELVFYVMRFNEPKYFQPLVFSNGGWYYRFPPKPRPLYNSDLINKYPNARVIIVEGEKTCEDAAKFLPMPDNICLTWSGGAKSVGASDWEILKDRNIIIWPDNDHAGISAATIIKSLLTDYHVNNQVSIVSPPENLPKKWDASNALADGWTTEQVEQLLKRVF